MILTKPVFIFFLRSHKYYLHKNVNNGKKVESGSRSALEECLLSEDMHVRTVLQLTAYNCKITSDMKSVTFYVTAKSKPIMSSDARNITQCFPCLKLRFLSVSIECLHKIVFFRCCWELWVLIVSHSSCLVGNSLSIAFSLMLRLVLGNVPQKEFTAEHPCCA